MIVYITGASGYLGGTLSQSFADLGHQVIALCRKDVFSHTNIKYSYFSLGEELEEGLPRPDACIHCSYDLTLADEVEIHQVNVKGSEILVDDLNRLGCKSIIHISSISAFDECKSKYGIAKLAIEDIVTKNDGISIRPGLIYGGANLGLIGKLSAVSKLPIVPLIGSGKYPQYLADIDILCKAIVGIVLGKYTVNTYVIAQTRFI